MGPNRMWMFPVGFTTRRTNDVPQQRELSVKSSFHRLHGPGASALSLHSTSRHTRGTEAWAAMAHAPQSARMC